MPRLVEMESVLPIFAVGFGESQANIAGQWIYHHGHRSLFPMQIVVIPITRKQKKIN